MVDSSAPSIHEARSPDAHPTDDATERNNSALRTGSVSLSLR